MTTKKIPQFRLFDFQVDNTTYDEWNDEEKQDNKKFLIKMFAMNEKGKTYCIYVKDFTPFFYVLVPDNWKKQDIIQFKQWLKNCEEVGEYYENSILDCEVVKKKGLYGFDNFKDYKFVKISFKNHTAFNKVKKLWYKNAKNFKKRYLKKNGLEYEGVYLKLYESMLPPLLRYFHIQNISPSGWATFNTSVKKRKLTEKSTFCNYEYETTWDNIKPLPEKESATPMKVMSWDIEASSSHGDFPVPKKSYRKMIGEIIQYWTKNKKVISKKTPDEKKELVIKLVLAAFKYEKIDGMSRVYLKKRTNNPTKEEIIKKMNQIISRNLGDLLERPDPTKEEHYYEWRKFDNLDDEEKARYKDWDMYIPGEFKRNNMIYCLNIKFDAGKKLDILDKALQFDYKKKIPGYLPKLEGDKCTFIGSTFLKLGEQEPYYNNMIVLDKCDKTPEVPNSEVVWKKKERNVLLAWAQLIHDEDPDIIIGYNTFGFDWHFLLDRADELGCKKEFLTLMNRNKKEECEIIESTTKVASGTYELVYVKIPGRIQIDLYSYFRKAENLPSYKLDYVASHFIGDIVVDYEVINKKTKIISKNLMGLKDGHFIVLEILGHSSDKYKEGKKFKISNLQKDSFDVKFEIDIDKKHKFRWCLAKDDVTPQDIFRLTNEGPSSKAIVAKYCFQDCNLVHNLMIKNDIYTAMVEEANICSVPIEFIAMRGQGIKLLSFIAKECSDKNTLMPDLVKTMSKDGYEGAICLKPKAGLYRDNPVAVVDYSSLYPSCMISDNISHDTKVWTKEYNLENKLINVWGEKNKKGEFKYDNLPGFGYVNITYDTYKYIRKSEKSAEVKTICGKKICRFVQFEGDDKGIMPTVLRELLASRKATRKLIKYKTTTMKNGESYCGLLDMGEEIYTIIPDKGDKIKVNKNDVEKVEDTYNDFMKNVFDKRQASKKVVANSLYGQSGAKTSSFYDKDIAASTTAMGRKLLLYGKRVIEECYGDNIVKTNKFGDVKSKAEIVYGDSVPGDEPLILRDENGMVTIKTIESLSNDWEQYENFKPFDTIISNRREKQKAFVKYEVWAKGKWNPIKKVIRHKTNKKIYRVNTHCGVVDVTEDHSLMNENFEKIKPEECIVGETKLSHTFPTEFLENECLVPEQGQEEKTDETLYECSTCKEKYKFNFYYITNKKTRGKQCKLCIKKRNCERLGKEFTGKLDKEIMNIHTKSYEITEDEARVWGMFMGDGSCGKYKNGKKGLGNKFSWALNNATLERLHYYKEILERVEPIKFKVLDTLESSGVYKLVPVGSIVYMVNKYRPLFYDENKAKLVPDCILNASLNIRKAFFEGYYDADGSKTHSYGLDKRINFVTKNKITAQCLYYLATSIGYDKLSVNIQPNRNGDYYWVSSCKRWGKTPNVLKKMVYLRNSEEEYVYDLETEHGIFACGVGKIEILNTDSCFFTFNLEDLSGEKIIGKKALEITIDLAIEAGKLASKFLKEPHDLEYEKTFMPFLLLSKKRYVGMLYEKNPNKCKMKSMGIVLKRRDNAACVKDCYGRVVDLLMKGESADVASDFVRSYIKDMVDEKIGTDKLIISKSLNGFYKNPDSIAHKVLADRMAKRDPGNKPSVGSRIPFIYIETKVKAALQGDRIETPLYITENNLKPDYAHYITNQIMKPITQVFNLLLEQMSQFNKNTTIEKYNKDLKILSVKYIDDEEMMIEKISTLRDKMVKKIIFDETLRKYNNAKNGQRSISSFFGKKSEKK